MRIAFYAPLKPPDHPVPSGDRRIAQSFLEALRRAGHEPFLASRLRSYGDPERQARIAAIGERTAERLARRWHTRPQEKPGLWFTYHLYYKAPDHLGPTVSAALGIPYVIAEASFAAKRAGGPWALGHGAVERAIRRADLVIGLNSADRAAVWPLLADTGRWLPLPPFLDAAQFAASAHTATGPPRLIAVAMMRPGDKLASYRLLGKALTQLLDLPWSLEIVGDGPARGEVETALVPLGDRVVLRGALQPAEIAERLAAADLFVWPAVNEAFGMALLEAQASALPVVAGNTGGVADVVTPGITGVLVASGDPWAFAGALRALLQDPVLRRRMGEAARDKVWRNHDLVPAAARLAAALARFGPAKAA